MDKPEERQEICTSFGRTPISTMPCPKHMYSQHERYKCPGLQLSNGEEHEKWVLISSVKKSIRTVLSRGKAGFKNKII